MSKWTLIAVFFLTSSVSFAVDIIQSPNACEKAQQKTEAKIKKNLDLLWKEIDSAVGVEFFLLVLKDNERMPASESLSDAEFYTQLLKGMKKTSADLSSHGLKLNVKNLKQIEKYITHLEKSESCLMVSSN